ncbi:acyl carrier protein [Streptomyces kutzneri]|uniref:acyl carrier protein n=1 Tax=Streptomyces kutzneri TaxID=3051179 RepID=UPI0028D55EE2|nr:acyl carrier protein [Streptomyces sp. DSM 40907]
MWDSRFEELLRRHLPFFSTTEPIAEDTSLRDYGLDSLAMVELLTDLEATYDIRFGAEALTPETFATAGTLWKSLEESLQPVD